MPVVPHDESPDDTPVMIEAASTVERALRVPGGPGVRRRHGIRSEYDGPAVLRGRVGVAREVSRRRVEGGLGGAAGRAAECVP